MSVYMIRAGDDGPVKIGVASSVEDRLSTLQTAHYEPLAVIRVVGGGLAIEAWLHERFAAERLRGEWFNFNPEMLTVEAPRTGKVFKKKGRGRIAYLERLRAALAIAQAHCRAPVSLPDDVVEIMRLWQRWWVGVQPLRRPQAADFDRLDAVIADPLMHIAASGSAA